MTIRITTSLETQRLIGSAARAAGGYFALARKIADTRKRVIDEAKSERKQS
jgi:hypothetical protein